MLVAKPTANLLFADLIAQHFAEKKTRLKKNSVKNEKSRRQNIIRFLNATGQLQISPAEIDESFIDDLESYLHDYVTQDHNYLIRHLRLVKEILTWAKKKKKIAVNPIADMSWKNGEDKPTPILSAYQVHCIESTIFQSEAVQQAADRLLIQRLSNYFSLCNTCHFFACPNLSADRQERGRNDSF